MASHGTRMGGQARGWIAVALLAFALFVLPVRSAFADYCSDYGGLLDGAAGAAAVGAGLIPTSAVAVGDAAELFVKRCADV